MMRTAIMTLSLLLAAGASAHEGKHDKATDKPAAVPSTVEKGPAKAATKLTGEVVDLTCYLSHDGHGAKHAKCALDCINKGNPVGILANDVLYTVIMSNHDSPNAKLAPFAGKQVVVTGTPEEKNGMHFVDLEKIEEAPAPKK